MDRSLFSHTDDDGDRFELVSRDDGSQVPYSLRIWSRGRLAIVDIDLHNLNDLSTAIDGEI